MVSVIVPTHNGGDRLDRCLAALADLDPPPAEIVVVNDGGTDDLAYARRKLGARVIDLPQTGGPAHARNRGALEATGDVLFFVDADVVVPPSAVGTVSEYFEQHPDVSAIIGSYDDEPAETNFLSQYRNLLHHFVHQEARVEASTFWGACGAIRRVDFAQIGGFDERRYRIPSIEDIELGIRLKKSGKRIRMVKGLLVRHLKRWDTGSMLRTDFCQRALPWSELIMREGIVNDLNTSIKDRVSVTLALLATGLLVASPVAPYLLPAGLTSIILIMGLNVRLYLFFARKRGLLFAAGTVPWHTLFYLQSGVAFVIAVIRSLRDGRRQSVESVTSNSNKLSGRRVA